MRPLNTYEIQFRKKLQTSNEVVKTVFSENGIQAIERGYQNLMREFPDSSKNVWEVKRVVKVDKST
jgi:hypothetical protein